MKFGAQVRKCMNTFVEHQKMAGGKIKFGVGMLRTHTYVNCSLIIPSCKCVIHVSPVLTDPGKKWVQAKR